MVALRKLRVCGAGCGRKIRVQYPGALYHVINRGNYQSDVFRTPASRSVRKDAWAGVRAAGLADACIRNHAKITSTSRWKHPGRISRGACNGCWVPSLPASTGFAAERTPFSRALSRVAHRGLGCAAPGGKLHPFQSRPSGNRFRVEYRALSLEQLASLDAAQRCLV